MTIPTDVIPFAWFAIKVNGSPLSTELFNAIVDLVIDSNLHLPNMCALTFQVRDSSVVDSTTFALGNSLEIIVKKNAADETVTLFKGEITALEPEFSENRAILYQVRGYDKSHRLYRGRKTRVFASVTYNDIVSKIASEAGLGTKMDTIAGTHEHVWQNNQNDMEFLRMLARRVGYVLYIEDATLHFENYASLGGPVTLKWGMNLLSFRPRISGARLSDRVIAQSWDVGQKTFVKGEVSSGTMPPQGSISNEGGNAAKVAFGSSSATLATYPGINQAEADQIAKSIRDALSADFIHAQGHCLGSPEIKAGVTIKIEDVGTVFSGDYIVTTATHTFLDNEYRTSFSVHGRRADTLSDLLLGDLNAEVGRGLVNGVVPAIVTNNNNTAAPGTVKVKFPWLSDELESGWIRLASPGAGAERGLYALPEVNDEVLVAFEHGDFNVPYIIGGLWNGKDALPPGVGAVVESGEVTQRIIRSRSGHLIILHDKDGAEQIIIRDKTGNNDIVIDSANNAITIKTTQGTVTVEAKGNITIKSTGGDMALEAQNITMQAMGKCDIQAKQTCLIEGTAGVTLKNAAGAEVALSGPKVSLNKGGLDVI